VDEEVFLGAAFLVVLPVDGPWPAPSAKIGPCSVRSADRRWPTSMVTRLAFDLAARCTASIRPSAATGRPPARRHCGRPTSRPHPRGAHRTRQRLQRRRRAPSARRLAA
jgi:hypothetical protein